MAGPTPTTAAQLITEALHLFGILDQTEAPADTDADIVNNIRVLNNMLRNEMADGACKFTINRIAVTLPPGVLGQPYSFMVGTADPDYLVQVDAVAVRSIYMNDTNITVSRETRGPVPMADVLRTSYPGIVTKWSPEPQVDGSTRVNAWQAPRVPSAALIEYGGRVPELTAAADIVQLPPEGIHDTTLLLGLTISGSYGRPSDKLDPVLLARAKQVDARWRAWARGQQWLRFVRS